MLSEVDSEEDSDPDEDVSAEPPQDASKNIDNARIIVLFNFIVKPLSVSSLP